MQPSKICTNSEKLDAKKIFLMIKRRKYYLVLKPVFVDFLLSRHHLWNKVMKDARWLSIFASTQHMFWQTSNPENDTCAMVMKRDMDSMKHEIWNKLMFWYWVNNLSVMWFNLILSVYNLNRHHFCYHVVQYTATQWWK